MRQLRFPRAGLRRALALSACAVLAGCRSQLAAPVMDRAPRADGSLDDWELRPRVELGGSRVLASAVQDDQRLSLLFEGSDPAWARAVSQGLIELRIGAADELGRQRALKVASQEEAGPGGPATGAGGGPSGRPDAGRGGLHGGQPGAPPAGGTGNKPREGAFDAAGPRETTWLWVLSGEDYQDERKLPLSTAPTPVARLVSQTGHWFLELELPLQRVAGLAGRKGRLDLTLLASKRSSGPGTPSGRGGVPHGGEGGGPGGGMGGGPGGGMGGGPGGGMGGGPGGGMGGGPGGGMGGGPGGRMGGGPGGGQGSARSQPEPGLGLAGLPLKLSIQLEP